MKRRSTIVDFLSLYIKKTTSVLWYIIILTLCGCEIGPDVKIEINGVVEAYALAIDPNSEQVDKNSDDPQVKFRGVVLDDDTQRAIAGVRLRLVGTDALEEHTITGTDGSWEIIAPIVPNRNDENTTIFAIEVQKDGAITAPLSEYCKAPVVWSLLKINNPNEYQVAGAYMYEITWENLYDDLE